MGPSGSGKSTLLNLIAGLDRPTSGAVTVAGERIDRLRETGAARFRRRRVGMIFQFFNLLDDLTVVDNVLLPAQLGGLGPPRARARADELLGTLGIERHRNAYPARLSGGERQRVAIARALDQPAGSLACRRADRSARQLDRRGDRRLACRPASLRPDARARHTQPRTRGPRYAGRTVDHGDGRLAEDAPLRSLLRSAARSAR